MADETKAGETATTTTPAATPTPTPPPTVSLSAEEYQSFLRDRARVAEIEAERKRDADEAERKRLITVAEKGEAEKALNTIREAKDAEIKKERDRADSLEAERLADRKGEAIASALLGATFVSDTAAQQVRTLLDARFEAVRDASGQVAVREKGTLLPASQVIKGWLASADAAHFQKPTSAGGSGASGGDRSTPTPSAADAETDQLPFDQKLVLAMKSQQAAAAPKYGFGLRPAAK